MAEFKVIDVSGWNTNVPYATFAQQGVKAAIIRITEKGNKVDSMFETHYKGFKNQGLKIGVYKYSYALSVAEIEQEARIVIQTLNKRKLDYPVFLDLEWNTQAQLGASALTKMTKAFRQIIVDAGYKFGIYCNVDWHDNILKASDLPYDWWLAAYPYNDNGTVQERLRPKSSFVGWQFTSKYNVNGKVYDMSVWNKDYSSTGADTNTGGDTMTKTEKATQWMINTANDNSHGYDQTYRWGERGDYDCSSAVCTAWQNAGVPVKTNGATYTGNMYSVFIKCGFKDITSSVNLSTGAGLVRGDVLLNHVHHVAMYIGNGQEVEASINERGGATGGQPGDQTGKEFLVRSYRNYPWNCVLRYTDSSPAKNYLSLGDVGSEVKTLQKNLNTLGYKGKDGKKLTVDGEFGENTDYAVRALQKANGLTVDGQVGSATQSKIKSLLNNISGGSSTEGNQKIKNAQIHLNNFIGAKLEITGKKNAATKKAFRKAIQTGLNMDYNCGLAVDGEIGPATEAALREHVVRKGSVGYLVTALEIGLLLNKYEPNGVESPGNFGSGVKTALGKFQKAKGLTVDYEAGHDTFMAMQK